MNIVAMASIDPKFTRDSISNMSSKYSFTTNFTPVLYPSLMFYHAFIPKFTASIYDSGYINIAGLKHRDEKQKALSITLLHIGNSIKDTKLKRVL